MPLAWPPSPASTGQGRAATRDVDQFLRLTKEWVTDWSTASFSDIRVGGSLQVAKLHELDQKRGELLNHAQEHPWTLILRWHGSVLPRIAWSPMNWLCILLYAVVRGHVHQEGGAEAAGLPLVHAALVVYLGGFLSFVLVFFVSQSYSRFVTQYFLSMDCYGRVFDCATMARASNLPRPAALRLLRHLNAAHLLAYVGLSSVYNEEFLIELNRSHRILTEPELRRVLSIGVDGGANPKREVIAWACRGVQEQQNQGTISEFDKQVLWKHILGLRGLLGTLYDYADQPLPFFYVHLCYLLSFLYLPLFAYAVACSEPASEQHAEVGWLLVLLNNIFVLGLRCVARSLADPYGQDIEDLRVISFVTTLLRNSRKLMEYAAEDLPTALDEVLEQRMFSGKSPLEEKEGQEARELEERRRRRMAGDEHQGDPGTHEALRSLKADLAELRTQLGGVGGPNQPGSPHPNRVGGVEERWQQTQKSPQQQAPPELPPPESLPPALVDATAPGGDRGDVERSDAPEVLQ